jgi:catechol 2,3-dioxygenase-like lactoylglutathione lyase family enzyme/mannose-6-phosphate isomerase-like protein (cupin superfamily)
MTVRRVATGTGPDGRSFVANDEMVEPVTADALPGYAWHRLWGFDDPATYSTPAGSLTDRDHFPPPGGVRFNLFTVPPESTVRPPLTEDLRLDLERKLPGRSRHMESDQAGMHRTASVDLIYVVAGRVRLDLDEGTVELSAGDSLVQNGTRHAWRNTSNEPCVLAIVLIGASPSPGQAPAVRLVEGFDWMLSCTTEFDSTVAFYRDVLGLEFTKHGPATTDTHFSRYACAVVADGGTLEVVEPSPGAPQLRDKQVLCLRVRDIHHAMAELARRGAIFTSGLFDNGEGLGWVYIRAPGGNVYQVYGPIVDEGDRGPSAQRHDLS